MPLEDMAPYEPYREAVNTTRKAVNDLERLENPEFVSKLNDSYVAIEKDRIAKNIEAFLSGFKRPTGAAVKRTGTTYDIYLGITDNIWWKVTVSAYTPTAGAFNSAVHQISDQACVVQLHQIDDTSMTVTGTWATSTGQPSTFGGTYQWSTTAGDTAVYTLPVGATFAGVGIVRADVGGLAVVSINGDDTRADYLPTAQQLVDAGASTLVASDLTTGGGSISPNARILDCYNASTLATRWMPLATDLNPFTQQTVTVKVLNKKRPAATAARVNITGIGYGLAGELPGAAGTSEVYILTAKENDTAQEYAVEFVPAGGSTPAFAGNWHGNEGETAFTVTVDGSPVLDGAVVRVNELATLTSTRYLRHPDTGTTHVADVTCTYTIDRDGLSVGVDLTPLVNITVNQWYGGMLGLSGINTSGRAHFDRAQLLNRVGLPITASGNLSDGYAGTSKSDAIAVWESRGVLGDSRGTGHLAAAVYPDDPIDYRGDWSLAGPRFASVNDRSNGALWKAYITRVGTDHTQALAAGATQHERFRYRFAWFKNAETALSGR